jgi:ABC-2 type transport system permease protein
MVQIKDIKKPSQLNAVLQLSKASFLSSIRNKTSLFFNFFFPFIFITIFGVLGSDNMSFDIAFYDRSVKEGPVFEALKEVDVVNLVMDKSDEEILEDLNKGRIGLALDIQKSSNFEYIPTYNITMYKSAANPDEASTLASVVNGIVNSINMSSVPENQRIVDISEELVEGRKYQQIDFILPGQLAFALLTNALFGISFGLLSMKKELIIKRIFASPAEKWTILFSEAVAKLGIGFMQAVLIIAVGYFLFDFTLANGIYTFISMLILSVIGLIVFLSMGLFIAAVSKNEDSVAPISNLIMMPQLFLSGAFFPIEAFPKLLQPIALILPMTLLNDSLKLVAFEGVSIVETLPKIGMLLLWGVVLYILNIFLFKWE